MYKVTRLIHLEHPDDQVADAVTRARDAAATVGATLAIVSPTPPGARNGGDVLVHLEFPTRDRWVDSRDVIDEVVRGDGTRHIDGVEYSGGGTDRSWTGVRPRAAEASVYRSLLLKVDDRAAPALVEKFERELLRMPAYVDSMMSWQLSRVDSAQGASEWTHVWEQSFTDLDGLLGAYMHHPVHWGYVDRWFDPECPDQLVKERVCHSFCAIVS